MEGNMENRYLTYSLEFEVQQTAAISGTTFRLKEFDERAEEVSKRLRFSAFVEAFALKLQIRCSQPGIRCCQARDYCLIFSLNELNRLSAGSTTGAIDHCRCACRSFWYCCNWVHSPAWFVGYRLQGFCSLVHHRNIGLELIRHWTENP
ncbi:hypothetical protein H6P81_016106 [Aristolochia fimbriata]|uniref:Uncharacterized protein n=1 Tax=Aristolochia fimbriata TaxID=158543 RepID=A0AAV7EAF5_ARIFI|nr:hypothetical protein H6P81_016106 [Aristolochia fimbriata]